MDESQMIPVSLFMEAHTKIRDESQEQTMAKWADILREDESGVFIRMASLQTGTVAYIGGLLAGYELGRLMAQREQFDAILMATGSDGGVE